VDAGDAVRTGVEAGDLADRLDDDREFELRILPDPMPRDAGKARLDEYSVRLPRQFQAHALIDDTTITHQQPERLAHVFSCRHGVEQEADLAWVRLLSEVKPEQGIVERNRGVFEEHALRRRGHPPPGGAQVVFSKVGATQQRRWVRAPLAQGRYRALDRKPRRGRQRMSRRARSHCPRPLLR
jgi:hypothetical protein